MSRYDAVNYLKYLDSLRASESFRSVWIFAESSYKIFEYAKKRVYHFGRSDSGKLGQIKTASTKKRKLNDNKKDEVMYWGYWHFLCQLDSQFIYLISELDLF